MKRILFSCFALLAAHAANSQIVTEISSIPEEGDALQYQTLSNITDVYLQSGADISWDFTEMYGDDAVTEIYAPASDGADADLFPDADLLIDFAGASAYAKRNTTNIEVIGIGSGGLLPELDDVEAQDLSQPFVVRRAPIGFEDSFTGSTDFGFTMWIDPESAIGTFIANANPFPDSTVDSLKAVFTIDRTEEVDSWGTVTLQNGEEVPALRLVQTDDISVGVELYLNTEFIDSWVDVSEFIDPDALGFGDNSTTNYIFLGEENKEFLLEITVDNTTEAVSGRYSSQYYVGVEDETKLSVSVYPNPATDELFVDGVSIETLRIIDNTGREVYTGSSRLVDVSTLTAGIYILEGLTQDGVAFTERIQIQ